jgi:hippurate hydrolase
MPHQTVDPIPVAAELVMAIQALVTRRVDVFDPAVVTVTRVRAGTTSNVIPETARMGGTIRTVSAASRAAVREALVRVAESVAAAHGCTAEVTLVDGYPVTVNDTASAERAAAVAADVVGADRVVTMPNPVMGAEDFSYVLERVPGAMVFLGTSPPGVRARDAAPNHSNRMVLDEAALSIGVALHVAFALGELGTSRPA